MSLESLTYDSTFDDVAKELIGECKRRGYSRAETIGVISTGIQESGLRMVKHPTADWWGYFQQDAGYPNRISPKGNVLGFLDRLDVKRRSAGASPNIFLNIFWLQQRPNDPSADAAYARGRQAYLSEIQRHAAQAGQLYDRYAGGSMAGWRGDPIWLADVLRAEGLQINEIHGWRDRGHGDFGDIWGVVCHHTGSNNASAESIAFHPTLGLASQLHLSRSGVYTMCGLGVAWHAGNGSWPGLPANGANQRTIGIEAANDGGAYPAVQYDAYVRGVAAILRRLGYGPDRAIGHKEWAGPSQGKWDPNFDMNVFRNDIQSTLSGGPRIEDDMTGEEHDKLFQVWGALFNPVVSKSKYRADGEGPKYAVKDQIGNIDGMSHEALIERNALLGNKDAIALVKREADKGDTWAKLVYDKCPR